MAFDADWLHKSMTGFGPITRIHVHVLAPKALGAMVGIAIAFDRRAAMPAGEVFFCPGELF